MAGWVSGSITRFLWHVRGVGILFGAWALSVGCLLYAGVCVCGFCALWLLRAGCRALADAR